MQGQDLANFEQLEPDLDSGTHWRSMPAWVLLAGHPTQLLLLEQIRSTAAILVQTTAMQGRIQARYEQLNLHPALRIMLEVDACLVATGRALYTQVLLFIFASKAA